MESFDPMETMRQRLSRLIREHMHTTTVDTQVKVAAKAGVSQSTVQRILSQEQAATIDLLESLAKAFSIKKPHHLLLDRDEASLLAMWGSLNGEDQRTVMGFIEMKAQVGSASPAKTIGIR